LQADIPMLLSVSREIQNGRPAEKVVGNLLDLASKYLQSAEHRKTVEKVFALATGEQGKHAHRIAPLRECQACGTRIPFSQATACQSCEGALNLPGIVRHLVCIDNLLWLLEHRIEPSSQADFAEFVCILVFFQNEILRKQSDPRIDHRRYALEVLRKVQVLCDANRGAVVSIEPNDSLKITLIKDHVLEDSETYAIFIYHELSAFVAVMKNGIPS
jgi:hypothetical protein